MSIDPILAKSSTTPADPTAIPNLDPPTTDMPVLVTARNPPPPGVPGVVTNGVVATTYPRHEPFMFVGPYSLNKAVFIFYVFLTKPEFLSDPVFFFG